jgi:hypothetical protein
MRTPRLGPTALAVVLLSLACSSGDSDELLAEPTPEPEAPSAEPEPARERGKRPRRQRPGSQDACSVSAYVVDEDPNGLNVRDAPEGKVIGQLPRIAMVGMREAKDGWVRYEGAEDWDAAGEPPQAGWVHASLLGVDIKTPEEYGPGTQPVLRVAPSDDAKSRAIRLDPVKVELVGCSGAFWEAEATLVDGKVQQGFLGRDSACGNPQTTCP